MVNYIFAKQIRAMALAGLPKRPYKSRKTRAVRHKQFLALLTIFTWMGCTSGRAAPPPVPPAPPQASCTQQIMVGTVNNLDANQYPFVVYTDSLNTKVCACSDGLVRWGAFCQ